MNNIAFIGGIHGVGKSTVCHQICDELNLKYLSASDLIKWKDISDEPNNKRVKEISLTQEKLITSIKNITTNNQYYLLDGHYCLLNDKNEIINIPLDTFKEINPICLNLIIGNIPVIKKRLEERDNRIYEYSLLEKMQAHEMEYAIKLSELLSITLNIGRVGDFKRITEGIKNTISYTQ